MDDSSIQVERSYDPEILTQAAGEYFMFPDNATWLSNPYNLMYRIGDDIGLATFDYPGLYTVHWFFKSRGKAAIKVCQDMLTEVFEKHGAEAVRGVTPIENKPARFLAKYVGCETISIEEFPQGTYELMLLSKERFNQFKEKNRWA